MFEFPWCDDFSAARNISLEPARGEWIFWMDSDDVIDQEQGRKLRQLVYGSHAEHCFGYVAQVHCESSESGQMTVVDHVKVFRNLPGLRFEHRIHEQILPAIRRAGGTVAFTDLYVTHKGSIQTSEVRQRKIERDFRILAKDLEERPDHPFVLFNLGMTHEDVGNYAEAEELLTRCLEASADGESHVRKTYSLLVNSLKGQGRLQSAVETANQALRKFPDDKELLFRRSILHLELNQLDLAARDMEQVIQESIDRTFQSLDQGITGHKAFHNLGVIYEQLGRFRDAENCWQQAIQLCPAFSVSWLALARLYLKTGNPDAADDLHVRMEDSCQDSSTQALIRALILEYMGQAEAAGDLLQQSFALQGDQESLDEAARIFLEHGLFERCLSVLKQLQQLDPRNSSVLHNLATVLEATGHYSEAISCLQESLSVRPENPRAQQQLARLLQCAEPVDGGNT
jgi:tetratricopeptide (TPR) repeat protein